MYEEVNCSFMNGITISSEDPEESFEVKDSIFSLTVEYTLLFTKVSFKKAGVNPPIAKTRKKKRNWTENPKLNINNTLSAAFIISSAKNIVAYIIFLEKRWECLQLMSQNRSQNCRLRNTQFQELHLEEPFYSQMQDELFCCLDLQELLC